MTQRDANLEVKMRILTAAKKMFACQGFDKTSIREICKEADVNVMMVSYHFRGKENLLSAIFQTYLPFKSNPMNQYHSRNPVERINEIINEVVTLRESDPELIKILQSEILLPTTRKEIVQFFILPLWKEISNLLELGKSQGAFHFESLGLTMTFITGSVLMNRHNPFFGNITESPLNYNIEMIAKETIALILKSLNYSYEQQVVV